MSETPLSFSWPQRMRVPGMLIGFILLSLFVHLVTFYLFQVEYPPSVTITPQPARVTLLRPDTAENQAFLRWIDASDPALVTRPPRVAAPESGLADFVPSFATVQASPVIPAVPGTRLQVGLPEAISGLALADRMTNPRPGDAAPSSGTAKTDVVFSDALRDRLLNPQPSPEIAGTAVTTPAPATFLLATPERNAAPLVFLQTGSGDDELDARARKFLRGLTFTPGETLWGFATFYWGPETLAPAKPAKTP